MPFDREVEAREPEPKIALAFDSGRPIEPTNLPMPPSAYLFLGYYGTDQQDRIMLTHSAASFGELRAQVDSIKAQLDARLAEAKAQFAATSP